MTEQKKKSKELIDYFQSLTDEFTGSTERHSLIFVKRLAVKCVDMIIESNPTYPLTGGHIELYSDMVDESIEFWQQVKQEIINYKNQ